MLENLVIPNDYKKEPLTIENTEEKLLLFFKRFPGLYRLYSADEIITYYYDSVNEAYEIIKWLMDKGFTSIKNTVDSTISYELQYLGWAHKITFVPNEIKERENLLKYHQTTINSLFIYSSSNKVYMIQHPERRNDMKERVIRFVNDVENSDLLDMIRETIALTLITDFRSVTNKTFEDLKTVYENSEYRNDSLKCFASRAHFLSFVEDVKEEFKTDQWTRVFVAGQLKIFHDSLVISYLKNGYFKRDSNNSYVYQRWEDEFDYSIRRLKKLSESYYSAYFVDALVEYSHKEKLDIKDFIRSYSAAGDYDSYDYNSYFSIGFMTEENVLNFCRFYAESKDEKILKLYLKAYEELLTYSRDFEFLTIEEWKTLIAFKEEFLSLPIEVFLSLYSYDGMITGSLDV